MRYAICCIVKNEGPYLKDWIDYHLSVGFTDIHIFEDDGSYSHKHITDAYDNVHVQPFSIIGDFMCRHNKQKRLYQWFFDNHLEDFDWCAFIDVDEYFMFEDGYDLYRLTEEFSERQGLYLYWKYHTANGRINRDDTLSVTEAYPNTFDGVLRTDGEKIYKSFVNFRSPNFMFLDHHTMTGMFNTDGEINAFGDKYRTFNKAWLAHYYTKSWEDWCYKMFERGDIFLNHRVFDEFFDINKDMLPLRDECYRSLGEKITSEYGVNTMKIYIHTHTDLVDDTPDDDFYTVTSNNPDVVSDKFDIMYLDDEFTKSHRISYGEGTTMRYLWKHPEILPDIVGMCHYRRFFKFNRNDRWNIIRNVCKSNAIITKPHPHGEGNTNAFVMRESHIAHDADLIDAIVAEKFPQYADGYEKMKSACETHPCSMFVMKRDDFLEMCDFIFGVMDEYDRRQGFTNDDDVLEYVKRTKEEGKWYYGNVDWQRRLQGFWIEWLVEAFVTAKWGIENVVSCDYSVIGRRFIPRDEPVVRDEQLIVSLTTWAPRFRTVSRTLKSLGEAAEGLDCHIVLVVSENDLNLAPLTFDMLHAIFKYKIEIIKDKGDIKSHKKLLPVLEKYPNNDILICDDDKIYDKDFIRNFIDDHDRYPNDVIVGGSFYNMLINDDNSFVCESNNPDDMFDNCHEPYEELHVAKPANGCFGTYYPKHTFTDRRFFDRDTMMSMAEYSDEDWHYLFNVIEDRTLRMTGHVRRRGYPDNNGGDSTALHMRFGPAYYEKINKAFAEKFPEYAEKMKFRLAKHVKSKKKSVTLWSRLRDFLNNPLLID